MRRMRSSLMLWRCGTDRAVRGRGGQAHDLAGVVQSRLVLRAGIARRVVRDTGSLLLLNPLLSDVMPISTSQLTSSMYW